jgi:hypothetical protein
MIKGSKTTKPLLEWHRRARKLREQNLTYTQVAAYLGRKRSAVWYALHGRRS